MLGMGPLGLAAAIAWIAAEGGPYFGLTVVGTYQDKAAPDEAAPAGSGRTVRPLGLAVPGVGPDLEDWLSAQGEIVDGRRYEFLVDRERQPWWPKDSGEGGFRGRWGPRVENDPLGRRAGMRFPRFWQMFFLALAKGKADGTL